MKQHNRICQLLNIKYPILQGAMAWVSYYDMVAAVCNEGALGILSTVSDNMEFIRQEIKKLKKLNIPFGVNIMLQSPNVDELAKLVIDEKVQIITTGGGNPLKYIDKWHEAGIVIMPVVASVGYAKLMERVGADAIIAEGMESGGHIGNSTSFSLIPQVCEHVKLPVIAAGGLYDRKSVLAAHILGAEGVQLGTRFLVSKECSIHQNYKNLIINANDNGTVIIGKRLGHPIRILKTNYAKKYMEIEIDSFITNEKLKEYSYGKFQLAVKQGDIEKGCFMSGQVAGRIVKEETVKDIISDLIH